MSTGPLSGVRVVELGSIGPGPFCGMLLSDLGAEVLRVDRASGAELVGPSADFRDELMQRGRRSVAVDLKHPDGAGIVLDLVEQADVFFEGFRPGVCERLGIGPDECMARNPRLIYGRMTGYGQTGPMAQAVGHDLNYIAQSGVLGLIGRADQPPTPPLAFTGDFGGGGMTLALGILAALIERATSGRGQVIDAAMIEGSAVLATCFFGFLQNGTWTKVRGTNIVDSGAPFYDAYETADGRYLSVAAMEPRFYANLLTLLELDPATLSDQNDRARWPEMKPVFAAAVRRRTLADWLERAEGVEACVAGVMTLDEIPDDPHLTARGSFVHHEGRLQPAPAPRFSRTPTALSYPPPLPGEHTREALADWGFDAERIDALLAAGVAGTPTPDTV
ncbi:MAG TPA: CaiB/BaiF CoA-transferase family protein [Solirubrobacteraceae bacterium]|jgi:alpha-methylacyl-CoA racemase